MTVMTIAAQPPQHMQALQRANDVHRDRARIGRALAAGEVLIADVLDDPAVQSMNVVRLLTKQHQWGPYKARRTAAACGISEFRSVRDLTLRQRTALLNHLTDDSTPRRTP